MISDKPTISVNIITWDDSYAIARRLKKEHSEVDLEQVSLKMIYEWVIALPEFSDDPEMANEGILMGIFQEWYEEVAN